MRILFIGDVIGRPGRRALAKILPRLITEHEIDFVAVNGENAAGGMGLTAETAEEMFKAGVHILTTGNHVWKKKEFTGFLESDPRVLRPANYPPGAPGRGDCVFHLQDGRDVGIINLAGRTFMDPLDSPFRVAGEILERLSPLCRVIVVDFHAEATSEKAAMGWFLDGKVTAVIGTHTHIQTSDERILANGTAYITDVGMTGPRDSIIGFRKELVIERFTSQLPVKFEVAQGPVVLGGVIIDACDETGQAINITRINQVLDD